MKFELTEDMVLLKDGQFDKDISQIAKLKDDGIITEEEFQTKKKELLDL